MAEKEFWNEKRERESFPPNSANPSRSGAMSRRTFVANALLVSTVILGGLSWCTACSSAESGAEDGKRGGIENDIHSGDEVEGSDTLGQVGKFSSTQYGFWMDTASCIGCGLCVDTCRKHNSTPDSMPSRRTLSEYEVDSGASRFISTACMHCAQPACMANCPAQAITKRDDGIVVVDDARCIGCKYCVQSCPFSVPHYGAHGMDKCDCCLACGVVAGEEPWCVRACKAGALSYGTLLALSTKIEAAGFEPLLLEASTDPSFFLT